MSGCKKETQHVSVICEVKGDNRSVQVVKYPIDAYRYGPNGSRRIFVSGVREITYSAKPTETWLLKKIPGEIIKDGKKICSTIYVGKGITLLYPLLDRQKYLNRDSVVIAPEASWVTLPINAFLIRRSTEKKYIYKRIPDEGGPYVYSSKNLIVNKLWATRNLAIKNNILLARQISLGDDTFIKNEGETDDSVRYKYYMERGEDCDVCRVIVVRNMISTDYGTTWKLHDYKALKIDNKKYRVIEKMETVN